MVRLSKIKIILTYLKTYGLKNLFLQFLLTLKKYRKNLSKKYIHGLGIEIGAGGNPLWVDKSKAKVEYVDYLPPEDLAKINYAFKKYRTVTVDHICDANDLNPLGKERFDFVIANHVFEHLRNPLKSLQSRYNILKEGGVVFMAIPDKRRTFDKHKEITKLEHVVLDYDNPSTERDYEHFKEFAVTSLEESGLKQPFTEQKIEKEAQRLLDVNYSIHYHIFIEDLVKDIILYGNERGLFNFDIIEVKSTSSNPVDNEFIFMLKKKS